MAEITPIWTGKRRGVKPGTNGAPCVYYHIAPPSYNPGEDLYSASALDCIEESRERWGLSDDRLMDDWDAISLHDSLAEAEDYAHDYGQPGGYLLKVFLAQYVIEGNGLSVYVNDEGYPCVRDRIPACVVHVLRRL